MKLNWYRLTLLDKKAEKILNRTLWVIVILGFIILVAFHVGSSSGEEMGGELLNDSTSSSQ